MATDDATAAGSVFIDCAVAAVPDSTTETKAGVTAAFVVMAVSAVAGTCAGCCFCAGCADVFATAFSCLLPLEVRDTVAGADEPAFGLTDGDDRCEDVLCFFAPFGLIAPTVVAAAPVSVDSERATGTDAATTGDTTAPTAANVVDSDGVTAAAAVDGDSGTADGAGILPCASTGLATG